MEDQRQKKASPIWHSDIPGMLGFFLIVPLVAVLGALFLPFVNHLRRHEALPVYVIAIVTGFVGIALLFFARMPLYRQHRFFALGSQHLDAVHRRLYRLAYGFIYLSGLLLLALLVAVGL